MRVGAQDTVRVSLSAVVAKSVAVSPDLAAQRADAAFASARLAMARASRFVPDLVSNTAVSMAPGISNPNRTDTEALYLDPDVRNDFSHLTPFAYGEVSFVQPVHTWGKLGGSVAAASAGRDVAMHATAGMAEDVGLRAAGLYYNLLLAEDFVQLTNRAGEVLEDAKTEIIRLLKEGDPDVDDADRYQLLMTEQELIHRLEDVQQQRQIARVALRRQLSLPDSAFVMPMVQNLGPITLCPHRARILPCCGTSASNHARSSRRPRCAQCSRTFGTGRLLSAGCSCGSRQRQCCDRAVPPAKSIRQRWIPRSASTYGIRH